MTGMPQNPFDDASGSFYALVNEEEQYSLWPTFKPVPAGWTIAYGAPDGASREEVLEWIEDTWTDLKPKSFRDQIAQYEQGQQTSEPSVDSAKETTHSADTAAEETVHTSG